MALSLSEIAELAARLRAAERDTRDIPKITDDYPELAMGDAYAVQRQLRADRLAEGYEVVGLKMGLTSRAKMEQMGVVDPIYGFLIDAGQVDDGGRISCAELIHPKVEAEIAFRLKHALRGPDCDSATVLRATAAVLPALEIIDSRYRDFKFDLPSVVADNTSAARFVLGSDIKLTPGFDLAGLDVALRKAGAVLASGKGSDVLGDPASSVAMLANMLALVGEEIPAGAVVLSGAATVAVAVGPGDVVEADWGSLGSVTVRFTE